MRKCTFSMMMLVVAMSLVAFVFPAQAKNVAAVSEASVQQQITPAITPAGMTTCAAGEALSAAPIGVAVEEVAFAMAKETAAKSEAMVAGKTAKTVVADSMDTAITPKTMAGTMTGISTRAAGIKVALTPATSVAFSGIFCS